MNPTVRINLIQSEVATWSLANFGRQESKVEPGLVLDSLAPFIGIAEEVGELSEALSPRPDTGQPGIPYSFIDTKDALADIGIYLMDFLARENLMLSPFLPTEANLNYLIDTIKKTTIQEGVSKGMFRMSKGLGHLSHATLKRHQGIRAMGETRYSHFLKLGLEDICLACHYLSMLFGFSWVDAVQETWDKVKVRDWKKNPGNANEVAEEVHNELNTMGKG